MERNELQKKREVFPDYECKNAVAMEIEIEMPSSRRGIKQFVGATMKEVNQYIEQEVTETTAPEEGPCPSRRPKPKPRRPRYYDCPVCGDDLEGKVTVQCQSWSLITCEMCHWSRYGQCAYCVEGTSDGSGAEDQDNAREMAAHTPEYVVPKDRVLRKRRAFEKKDGHSTAKRQKEEANCEFVNYQDPDLTERPRSASLLARSVKMVLLIVVAYLTTTFWRADAKTSFLQEKDIDEHVFGIPVPELAVALNVSSGMAARLKKSFCKLANASLDWYLVGGRDCG